MAFLKAKWKIFILLHSLDTYGIDFDAHDDASKDDWRYYINPCKRQRKQNLIFIETLRLWLRFSQSSIGSLGICYFFNVLHIENNHFMAFKSASKLLFKATIIFRIMFYCNYSIVLLRITVVPLKITQWF